MFKRLTSLIRRRWHPLWRLRQLSAFRLFQRCCDRAVNTRIPGTNIRVAVMLFRDASWILASEEIESEIRRAFTLVLDLLQPSVFWDVGANIGFYSWFVRNHASIRQVVMFDPDPTNFELLTRTIHNNRISNCRVMNLALADQSGEASFLLDLASGATGSLEAISQRGNESSLHHAYEMSDSITCRTATIEGLIAEGVPPPDFMKIDVEGAEHLVLEGGRTYIAQWHPTMIIETANHVLVEQLVASGFSAFKIDAENWLFVADTKLDALSVLNRHFP